MCGLTGIVDRRGHRPDERLLRAMIGTLRHRGPDAEGVQVMDGAGLAHSRLSIIDIAGGSQPMADDDGRVVLVFNGEIFNHVELREELSARGHRFRTRSDTEVLLRSYLEHGEACVDRLNGQWAFAIWDGRKNTLFASRDRIGIRPFYYAATESGLVFGSEIKALLTHPEVSRAFDPEALRQILTFWAPIAPRSVFAAVRELPPAHCLRYRDGQVETWRYWELDYRIDRSRTERDGIEELRALLLDATRLRLTRADVPVGAYLSGGLDSSVTTAVARQLSAAPLSTFSITFEDPEFDESEHQRHLIEHLGVDHKSVQCRSADIGEAFPRVIWHAEQPLFRTAPAPMFLLSGLVHGSGYKVVLTGEGADEMLGGYDIFKEAKVRRFWARRPDSKLRPLLLRKLYPYIPGLQAQSDAYLQAFFHARPEDLDNPFFSHIPRWELGSRLHVMLAPEVRAAVTHEDPYADIRAELPEGYAAMDPFCQAQYLETRYLLPGYILSAQGDRMAMAHSVEGRYPFLDHRVAELAASLPPNLKMKVLDEKHVIKRAFGELLPESVRRRKKQPYRAPDASSFFDAESGKARFEYVDALLSEEALKRNGVFHAPAVKRLAEKARRGRLIGVKDSMALVSVLSTQLLFEQLVHRLAPWSP